MKKVLIVGWGTWASEYAFVVAKKKGLDIYLATPTNYPSWVSKYVKREKLIFTDVYNSDVLIIDTLKYCKKHNINFDAIVSYFELNVVHAADLASTLSLPSISPHAARRSSVNKLAMREVCRQAGIPTPRFMAFESKEEALMALNKIERPSIIKPIMFGHSYGVVKIDKKDSVKTFLKKINHAMDQLNPRFYPMMKDYHKFNGQFILEEYLKGTTVSVDGLIQNNKIMIGGLTEFVLSPDESFTQQSAYIPGRINKKTRSLCFEEAKKILKVLEFNNCGFHCEMILTSKGPRLLEVAARLPGGRMAQGYLNAYGIDMMDLYFNICLGKKIKLNFSCNEKYVFHHSIFLHKWGEVTKIEGFNKLKRNKYFTLFSAKEKGDLIQPVTGIPEPIAYFQIVAPTRKKLIKYQKEVKSTIEYKISKTPKASYDRFLKLIKSY